MEIEEQLQDIKDLRHLSEYQHPMAASFALAKEVSQTLELSAIVLK